MSSEKKLTLIIPSYNRHKYALRSLRFWSGKGIIVHLIDGTDHAIEPEELANLEGNVFYHHKPIDYFARLKYAAHIIETPYVALLSDDEFFSLQAINDCLLELEANEELVSCTGRCISFSYHKGKIIGNIAYPEMDGYAVLQDDPRERVLHHMDNYTCSSFYAVVRTQAWRSAVNVLLEKQYPFFASFELQFEFLINFYGKTRVLDSVMWYRSKEQAPVQSDEVTFTTKQTFNDWWRSSHNLNEREGFIDGLLQEIENKSLTKDLELKKVVIQAFDAYARRIDMRNHRSFRSRIIMMKNRTVIGIAGFLPQSLKNFLRPYVIKPAPYVEAFDILIGLEQSGCRISFDDFEEIKTAILASYE